MKEALEYVRKLKLLGIGVQFEKEGIYTLALGDEMLLNTFTAIAQEESKAISQNQRLSIVKRMERGEYVDSNAPYGFRLHDKKLKPFDQEADVVRYIFQQYLSGWSTSEIARDLTEKGIQTKLGKEQWRSTKISYILSNERYVGDCRYQKTYRDTTVPFRQSKNRGQEDMFYASETHDPIIDRESFERVQALLQDRKERFSKSEQLNVYPLTSRIRCSECGSFYRRKVRNGAIKWVCAKHSADTHACPSGYYSEERIYDGFITIVNKLRFGEERILDQVIAKLETTAAIYKRNNISAGKMSQSIAELNAKLVTLEQLRSKGYLAIEVYQSQARDIQKQISDLKSERRNAFEHGEADIIRYIFDEYIKGASLKDLAEELTARRVLYTEKTEVWDISKNITWSYRNNFEDGKPIFMYKKLLGYKKGEDGEPVIVPQEAEIVERIYTMYLSGMTVDVISRQLQSEHIVIPGKTFSFGKNMVMNILKNEKYCGDCILQKTVTVDCISKTRKKNEGEAPMYIVENSHPAIISREMFNRAQEELSKRKARSPQSQKTAITASGKYSKYALTDVLICAECGSRYKRVTWTSLGQKRIVWRCVNRLDNGKKYCQHSPTLSEPALQEAIVRALNKFNDEDTSTYLLWHDAAQLTCDILLQFIEACHV